MESLASWSTVASHRREPAISLTGAATTRVRDAAQATRRVVEISCDLLANGTHGVTKQARFSGMRC